MSNRAWMPLHIDDYLADTGHLTGAEHGAYMLMIMHYWQNGRLPDTERLIARIARMDADQWAESRDLLAMLFGPNWTHKRIDAELEKADGIIEKRRAAAVGRHSRSKPDANAQQVNCKSSDTGALPLTEDLNPDANASGAASPADPRNDLWTNGVSTLRAITGKTEGASRSMIGKWLKDAKDDCALVLGKIQTAQRERIGDPISWITAALKPPDKPPKKVTHANMWNEEAIAFGIIDEPARTPDRRLDTGLARGSDQSTGYARRIAGA